MNFSHHHHILYSTLRASNLLASIYNILHVTTIELIQSRVYIKASILVSLCQGFDAGLPVKDLSQAAVAYLV